MLDPEAGTSVDHLNAVIAEQAALRRVATIVAADGAAERVVALVVEETKRLLGANPCVGALVAGDHFRVIGCRTDGDDDLFPIGGLRDFRPGSAIEAAVRTGESVVVEDFSTAQWQGRLRERGYRAGAVAPIVVGGRVWGSISIAYREPRPDMAEMGQRLTDFTALVSLGVVGAEARRLDEARDRLAAILEWSDMAIMAVSRNGTVTAWNHRSEDLFGWTTDEIVGQPLNVLMPDDRAHEVGLVRRVFAGEEVPAFETERRHKDGRTLDVSISLAPIRNTQGEVIGVSASVHDLSERRTREVATARLESVVEQSQEALAAFDADGRVTLWNKAAERLFGYDASELLGRPASLLADGSALDEQEELVGRVLTGE